MLDVGDVAGLVGRLEERRDQTPGDPVEQRHGEADPGGGRQTRAGARVRAPAHRCRRLSWVRWSSSCLRRRAGASRSSASVRPAPGSLAGLLRAPSASAFPRPGSDHEPDPAPRRQSRSRSGQPEGPAASGPGLAVARSGRRSRPSARPSWPSRAEGRSTLATCCFWAAGPLADPLIRFVSPPIAICPGRERRSRGRPVGGAGPRMQRDQLRRRASPASGAVGQWPSPVGDLHPEIPGASLDVGDHQLEPVGAAGHARDPPGTERCRR